MYCEKCGAKLDIDSLFCTSCGTKIELLEKIDAISKESKQNSSLIYEIHRSNENEDKDVLEIIYFKNNYIFISNIKYIFTGFEGESTEKKNYEISAKLIKASHKKIVDYSIQFGVSFVLFLIFFLKSIGDLTSMRETSPMPMLLLFLVIIAIVIYYTEYKKEKKRNPIRIEAIIEGNERLYIIDSPSTIEDKEINDILNGSSQEINERSRKLKELEEKKRKIEEQKLRQIQADNLKKLKNAFIKSLDSTYTEIKIPSINFLSDNLEKNQNEIAKLNPSWIHDLIKIKSYLLQANTSIKSNYIQTLNEKNTDNFKKMQAEVIAQIEAYDKIYGNSLILIDSVIDRNYVLSYEIYEIFDKLGFFESNWEQKIIKKFEDLTDSIDDLNSNINAINKNFELITDSNISNMTEEMPKSELLQSAMPLLSLYGGYKLGYHMFGPSKK